MEFFCQTFVANDGTHVGVLSIFLLYVPRINPHESMLQRRVLSSTHFCVAHGKAIDIGHYTYLSTCWDRIRPHPSTRTQRNTHGLFMGVFFSGAGQYKALLILNLAIY